MIQAEGLCTTSWRHKVTGTDFMARASAQNRLGDEFSFRADQTRLTGLMSESKWEILQEGKAKADGGISNFKKRG
jgi:hypothetical protein